MIARAGRDPWPPVPLGRVFKTALPLLEQDRKSAARAPRIAALGIGLGCRGVADVLEVRRHAGFSGLVQPLFV